jgi:hypothetical protein
VFAVTNGGDVTVAACGGEMRPARGRLEDGGNRRTTRDGVTAETAAGVEVTPAMIDAGLLELARFTPDYESEENAVVRIYLAMTEAHRGHRVLSGEMF